MVSFSQRLTSIRLVEQHATHPHFFLPNPDVLLPYLEKYLEKSQRRLVIPRRPFILPTTLIAQATASAPLQNLSEHTANVLSDLFPSLKKLEEGTRTQAGREMIYEYLDKTSADNVIDFWEDEWVV